MTHDSSAPIILAAGGTGGHIFPAEALAEVLIARGEKVVFITDKRFANYQSATHKSQLAHLPIYTIRSGNFSGGLSGKMRGAVNIILGVLQARRIINQVQPKAIIGFGGYPSFPTMMAGISLGRFTIIHEQNSVLGRANRFLSGQVTRIATSYAQTQRLSSQYENKVIVTGNPVRAAIKALHHIPYPLLQEDAILRLLVLGGSQGASVFASVIPAAIKQLPERLRQRIHLCQQARPAEVDAVKAAYAELNVPAEISSFFYDVPARLAAAHLMICRAGASTVAELACAGRPAILVPYPQAMDNHQLYNAQAIEDQGGGWVMPQEAFTAEALASRLETFLTLPATLNKAADKLHQLSHINAAEALADLVLNNAKSPAAAKITLKEEAA